MVHLQHQPVLIQFSTSKGLLRMSEHDTYTFSMLNVKMNRYYKSIEEIRGTVCDVYGDL